MEIGGQGGRGRSWIEEDAREEQDKDKTWFQSPYTIQIYSVYSFMRVRSVTYLSG